MKISPINMETRSKLDLQTGDTVRVYQKIQEKDKTRLQPFEGLVLARNHRSEPGATFTVRRVSDGYGVEKIFPLYSPMIDRIEIIKRSKTRRSKIYNIRRQAIKQISKRMKMMFVNIKEESSEQETLDEENKTPAEDSKEETTIEEKSATESQIEEESTKTEENSKES